MSVAYTQYKFMCIEDFKRGIRWVWAWSWTMSQPVIVDLIQTSSSDTSTQMMDQGLVN